MQCGTSSGASVCNQAIGDRAIACKGVRQVIQQRRETLPAAGQWLPDLPAQNAQSRQWCGWCTWRQQLMFKRCHHPRWPAAGRLRENFNQQSGVAIRCSPHQAGRAGAAAAAAAAGHPGMTTEASICHTTVSSALSAASRPTSLHALRPCRCAARCCPLTLAHRPPSSRGQQDARNPPPTGDRS